MYVVRPPPYVQCIHPSMPPYIIAVGVEPPVICQCYNLLIHIETGYN